MSLKCQKTQRLLSDYFDGTLFERQMKAVDKHLKACLYCKREAINLKKMSYLLENFYVEPEASDAYYARFTKELHQRIEQTAPIPFYQRLHDMGTKLTWQLLTQLRRAVDHCIPCGFTTLRQKMLPYYALVATMMMLLVVPFALKLLPSGENGEQTLGHLYAVVKARLFSTSIDVSRQPAATLAIQRDTAAQPTEVRRNVSRNRTTEMLIVDSGTDVWQFTDDPLADGYILTTLLESSEGTLPSVALDIDSKLLTYAELSSQGTPWEYPTAREVLTDGRHTLLLLQGIHLGQQVPQQYQRKRSQPEDFSRKLLDVSLETLSITEIYDSIEL